MGRQRRVISRSRRWGRLAWLPFAVAIAVTISLPARAQETPTPEETPEDVALIRFVVPEEAVDIGDEFEAEVRAEEVEHMGAFDFALTFDAERLSFERMVGVGELLATGRRTDMICADPMVRDNTVRVSCITAGPPLCLGGDAGATGSGPLARAVFRAKTSGTTTLELTDPTHLLLDDFEPCDPAAGRAVEIPHRRENATIEVSGGGSFPWVIVGPVIGVVGLLVIAIGGLAFLRYRQRTLGVTP